MERCGGRGVGEPQLMLDRGTSVIFVMSRVVLRDAGVHLAAIAMALKLASAGLDDLCYRLGCRRGNKGEIASNSSLMLRRYSRSISVLMAAPSAEKCAVMRLYRLRSTMAAWGLGVFCPVVPGFCRACVLSSTLQRLRPSNGRNSAVRRVFRLLSSS